MYGSVLGTGYVLYGSSGLRKWAQPPSQMPLSFAFPRQNEIENNQIVDYQSDGWLSIGFTLRLALFYLVGRRLDDNMVLFVVNF